MSVISKLPLTIIIVWISITFLIYFFFIGDSTQRNSLTNEKLIDAVVLICTGKMAASNLFEVSFATIRKIGRWKGDIFVITDNPDCLKESARVYDLKLIIIPAMNSLMHVKSLKANLFKYLPASTQTCIYLDSDIFIMRNLNTFTKDLTILLSSLRTSDRLHTVSNSSIIQTPIDLGLFLDARGHFFGFCTRCDKWHTGVMLLRRWGLLHTVFCIMI